MVIQFGENKTLKNMKLIELVNYFRKGGSFERFCQDKYLDLESEAIEIYVEKSFNLDNNLAFFEIEKTEGRFEYTFNGITYFNLFDFYYFLGAIEESSNDENRSLSDNEIAHSLLSYAIKDA